MFKLFTKVLFRCSGDSSNILKNFGITNPNILRNSSYTFPYSEFPNSSKPDSPSTQLILPPKTVSSPPLEHLLPTQERKPSKPLIYLVDSLRLNQLWPTLSGRMKLLGEKWTDLWGQLPSKSWAIQLKATSTLVDKFMWWMDMLAGPPKKGSELGSCALVPTTLSSWRICWSSRPQRN